MDTAEAALEPEDGLPAGAAGGSAAFRRLLLEQHEAARAQAAAAAGAGLAEWMATVTTAAMGAGASAEEARVLAGQMRVAAAAHMHPVLAASMGLLGGPAAAQLAAWPGLPAGYGMPLHPAAAAYAPHASPAMLGAMRHLITAHAQHSAAAPPLFAAAK
jgi:hypothetical protein